MRNWMTIALGCAASIISASLLGFQEARSALAVDHSDPAAVTQAIFDAASTGDSSMLASLCDPEGKNDGDTRWICEITPNAYGWAEFVNYFKFAKLNGEVKVQGDRAAVPFLFGPNGTQEETMLLIKRNGKWYLFSF
jgi:hypothetical protein